MPRNTYLASKTSFFFSSVLLAVLGALVLGAYVFKGEATESLKPFADASQGRFPASIESEARSEEEILYLPVENYENLVRVGRAPLPFDCQGRASKRMTRFGSFIAKNCVQPTSRDSSRKAIGPDCSEKIWAYRALRIRCVGPAHEDPSRMSDVLLANRAAGWFLEDPRPGGAEPRSHLDEIDQLTEELRKRFFDWEHAWKLALLSAVVRDDVPKLKSMTTEAIRKFPKSAEIREFEFYLHLREGQFPLFKNAVAQFAATHPKNPVGFYWLGISQWKEGRREQALRSVQSGLRFDPRSERLRYLHKELTRRGPESGLQPEINIPLRRPGKPV